MLASPCLVGAAFGALCMHLLCTRGRNDSLLPRPGGLADWRHVDVWAEGPSCHGHRHLTSAPVRAQAGSP
jgi:hypothetical protein